MIWNQIDVLRGFSGESDGKASACDAGDLGSIPGLGRSPGEGNSYSFQYSDPQSSMDRGAWQAIVYGVTKSRTRLSGFHFLSDVSSAWHSIKNNTHIFKHNSTIIYLLNLHMHAKLLQLYLTLLDPMGCSPPGFSVHGILQARILEWFAMPSSRESSRSRDQTRISHGSNIAGRFFTTEPPGKALNLGSCKQFTWTLKNFSEAICGVVYFRLQVLKCLLVAQ